MFQTLQASPIMSYFHTRDRKGIRNLKCKNIILYFQLIMINPCAISAIPTVYYIFSLFIATLQMIVHTYSCTLALVPYNLSPLYRPVNLISKYNQMSLLFPYSPTDGVDKPFPFCMFSTPLLTSSIPFSHSFRLTLISSSYLRYTQSQDFFFCLLIALYFLSNRYTISLSILILSSFISQHLSSFNQCVSAVDHHIYGSSPNLFFELHLCLYNCMLESSPWMFLEQIEGNMSKRISS